MEFLVTGCLDVNNVILRRVNGGKIHIELLNIRILNRLKSGNMCLKSASFALS